MTHALKTLPEYFVDISNGQKKFELRKDDRPYEVGDKLILQEYNATDGTYTGREETFLISYILRNAEKFGLKKGYCILGLREIEPA